MNDTVNLKGSAKAVEKSPVSLPWGPQGPQGPSIGPQGPALIHPSYFDQLGVKLKIGFTGTRRGMTAMQKTSLDAALKKLKLRPRMGRTALLHGVCVGADEEAVKIAKKMGIMTIGYPPENAVLKAKIKSDVEFPPKPYLSRNHQIVDDCNVLIAAPKSLFALLGGTWSTFRYARKRGRTIVLIEPSGTVTIYPRKLFY
jgi:hypothetical protein